ncbi:MAG TPA: hypothetical protein P5573_08405 [Syntrophales bacterium]|jgi:hypothetical protein|nr:hypothetical protein [Syntrophales bacterium]
MNGMSGLLEGDGDLDRAFGVEANVVGLDDHREREILNGIFST